MDNIWLANEVRSEYNKAHRAAQFRRVMAVITRHRHLLVPYEEVRQRLYAPVQIERGIQTIPVGKIVGSLGRAKDFTREFLPLNEATSERWRRIRAAAEQLQNLPPIEVYLLCDVYFVSDGNHRVSVARSMGIAHIEARVIEIPIRTAMTPNMDPQQILLAAERAGFLAHTNLDTLRPNCGIEFTIPGGYGALAQQIDQHRQALQASGQPDLASQAAILAWYDDVYLPISAAIRDTGLLAGFPGRTEADLYVWMLYHLVALQAVYGPGVDAEIAFTDFVEQRGGDFWGRLNRAARRLARRVSGDDTPPIIERLVAQLEEREIERLVDELAAEEDAERLLDIMEEEEQRGTASPS